MDAQLVFRILLIIVATVALVAIIMHYNSCMAGSAPRPYEGFAADAPGQPPAPSHAHAPSPGHAPSMQFSADASSPPRPTPPKRRSHEDFADGGMSDSELLSPLNAPELSSSAAAAPAGPVASVPAGSLSPVTPGDLLPKLHPDAQAFAELYPCGQGDLNSVNFLDAGAHIGISTNTKRNANYGLRSDPPLPKKNVSPWNMSTFAPDCYRKSFDIGS